MSRVELQKVIITVGLPGSGKSSWARDYVHENHNTIIISRDKYREMFTGVYTYDDEIEKLVRACARQNRKTALEFGYDVIVDEVHITRAKRAAVKQYITDELGDMFCERLQFWIVEFIPDKSHLDRRLKDPRGYDEERWRKVYNEMLADYEPVQDYEADKVIRIIPNEGDRNESVSVEEEWL